MPGIDFAEVKRQASCELLLRHLGWRPVGRRMGQQLRGPCPLHGSRASSRSLAVNGPSWYCHRCQEGGDVLRLAMALRGCNVSEAAGYLCGIAAITVPLLRSWHSGTEKRNGTTRPASPGPYPNQENANGQEP